MQRLALVVAVVIAGMSPAEAAARHKHKVNPAVTQSAPVVPAVARRPALGAAPQQCLTDDGYGRFLPCDVGDGR